MADGNRAIKMVKKPGRDGIHGLMSTKAILVMIFIFALTVRLGIVLTASEHVEIAGDIQHHLYAKNILTGTGFEIENTKDAKDKEIGWTVGLDKLYSFKPPLYALMLAGTYFVFGEDSFAVALIQGFIGAITCLLIYCVGKSLYNRKTGVIAASILAVYPYLAFQVLTITDTTLGTFLLVACVCLLYKVVEQPDWINKTAVGILLGATVLCRANMLAFLPLALFWVVLFQPWQRMYALKVACFIGAVSILVLVPWSVRNSMLHKGLVILGTNGGYTFWQSNNPFTEKYISMKTDLDPISQEFDWNWIGWKNMSETERDRWFYKQGLRFICEKPTELIKLARLKFISLWSWNLFPESDSELKNAIYKYSYGPILVLGLVGIILSSNKWRKTSLLVILAFSFSIVYTVFYGKSIYRAPLDPFLIVFSAYTLHSAWEWYSKSHIFHRSQ